MNMSYCRFQNTHTDLQDCWEALEDGLTYGLTENVDGYSLPANLSDIEKRYAIKLIKICENIVALTQKGNFEE